MLDEFGYFAVWYLIAQSDWMSKAILLVLFFLSVVCGTICIYKFFYLRYQRKQLAMLIKRLKSVRSLNDLFILSKEFSSSVGGRFILQNLTNLKEVVQQHSSFKQGGGENLNLHTNLDERDLEYLELILGQSLEQFLIDEERYLPILGTSAAVSPLIGLFGTVWGLIHAFVNISQQKSADIAVVAPGIAEALMTTLAGLLVAIPALVFFHYFSNKIRKIEQQLITVSDTFFAITRKTMGR